MTTPRKFLIVNGDDFGLSTQVNAGIVHAHRHGILTNASLMVGAAAWEKAVTLAHATPSLSVGLHLTLVQGRAVLPPRLIPNIVDSDGNFPNNPMAAGLHYFFSRHARVQMLAECRAQIERFLVTDLPLAQVDGHVNIHMHPTVLDGLMDLAGEYRIGAVRVTQEPLGVGLALDAGHIMRKCWEGMIFTLLARNAARKLRTRGIVFANRLFGLHQSGNVNEAYLLKLLPRLSSGVTELYCHPAFLPCAEVARWTPTYQRDAELQALSSTAVRATLTAANIILVSYRDLQAAQNLVEAPSTEKPL
jgi:chitin disaccharide deacetylase